MRFALLVLCVLGLTIGVNGQATSPGETSWKVDRATFQASTQTLADGVTQVVTMRMTAHGVEIRLGGTVITADSAQTSDVGGGPIPREFVLSGNVRLRAVIDLGK